MPRRYWDYDPQYQIYHQLSTIGAFVLGISMFTTVVYLFASFWTGKKAPRNPWGGSSLEWQAPTPPPLYNFEKPPVLHELYNYDDLVEVEEDRWERQEPANGEPASVLHGAHGHAAPVAPAAPVTIQPASGLRAEGEPVTAAIPPEEPGESGTSGEPSASGEPGAPGEKAVK
jgi:hypothetical protein